MACPGLSALIGTKGGEELLLRLQQNAADHYAELRKKEAMRIKKIQKVKSHESKTPGKVALTPRQRRRQQLEEQDEPDRTPNFSERLENPGKRAPTAPGPKSNFWDVIKKNEFYYFKIDGIRDPIRGLVISKDKRLGEIRIQHKYNNKKWKTTLQREDIESFWYAEPPTNW